MILVKETGKGLTEYLQEKIWNPIGAEFDGYWLNDHTGMEMALGGLNVCLRDYAKMGQLFLHRGNWQGQQLVPESWVQASVTPDASHLQPNSEDSAHPGIGYGYQWWVPDGDEGEFMANGVFNQYIYVNPTTRTVIVKNSANQNYYDVDNPYRGTLQHVAMFRAIAHSLVPEGIPSEDLVDLEQ
jgi:CubicO group peptidase (beta-lactamase class C family)